MDTIKKAFDLMENKQNEEALQLLEDYLPLAGDEQKYTIAELYWQWGFLEHASAILKELYAIYPDESQICVMLADIYIELDNDQAAVEILDHIKEDDPAYVQVLLQLADLYQAQGLFEVAEIKLLTAKQYNPDEPIIDFALGEFFFSIGEYERSLLYYESLLPIKKEIADVSIPTRLAEAYAASGKYEKALGFFQELKSDDPDLLFKYGFTANQAKRKDIAINAWKEVIKHDPSYHTVYYELAKVYREEGLIEEAYKTIMNGLQMDEFNKEIYYFAGVLASELNNPVECEKLIRQAIVLDADYKEAVLFLIELFKEQDNFTKIIDLITEIKTMGAYDGLYEWELAKAYNEMELYDDALNAYNEAYNTLHDDSDFLKEYGYYLTEDGKIKEAIPIFKAYLKVEPTDIETESYLNRLNQTNEE